VDQRGVFIVLEGIDGAGKTEASRRLAAFARELGRRVVETREPTDGEWGRRYRAWARGEADADATPDDVLHFFIEDRREHVARTIAPALGESAVVICDRYLHSTLAYQAAQGLDREALAKRMAAEAFPEPDLVLWLRLPVAQALARLGQDATERFEKREFLERVDAEYEALGLAAIDASGTADQVAATLQERVASVLSAG
jgi:dTMP kinase